MATGNIVVDEPAASPPQSRRFRRRALVVGVITALLLAYPLFIGLLAVFMPGPAAVERTVFASSPDESEIPLALMGFEPVVVKFVNLSPESVDLEVWIEHKTPDGTKEYFKQTERLVPTDDGKDFAMFFIARRESDGPTEEWQMGFTKHGYSASGTKGAFETQTVNVRHQHSRANSSDSLGRFGPLTLGEPTCVWEKNRYVSPDEDSVFDHSIKVFCLAKTR